MRAFQDYTSLSLSDYLAGERPSAPVESVWEGPQVAALFQVRKGAKSPEQAGHWFYGALEVLAAS